MASLEVIHITDHNRKIYRREATPSVVAIGFFDGVHKGHRAVLNKAKTIAKRKQMPFVCMSFYPHPKEVLANDSSFPYLIPLTDKQEVLEAIGVDKLYIVEFDEQFASVSPERFVNDYLIDLGAVYVVAGFDFTYGHKGIGNMDRMEQDAQGKLRGIKVDPVVWDREEISSTLIRQLIRAGEMNRIPNFLGDYYKVKGTFRYGLTRWEVVLKHHYLVPPNGSYDVLMRTKQRTWSQRMYVHDQRMYVENLDQFNVKENEAIEISWLKRSEQTSFIHIEQSI